MSKCKTENLFSKPLGQYQQMAYCRAILVLDDVNLFTEILRFWLQFELIYAIALSEKQTFRKFEI